MLTPAHLTQAPLFKFTLFLSEFELGTLFAAYAVISLLACPFIALYYRDLPYKACFVFGGVLCGVSSVMLAILHNSFGNILLSRLLHGLGATVVWLAGPVVVCDLFGVASRTKAMGVVYIYATTAFLLGAVLGANSFDWTGSSFPILMSTTVLNIFTTTLLATSLPSDRSYGIEGAKDQAMTDANGAEDVDVVEEGKAGYRLLLGDRTVQLVLLTVFLFSVANIVVQAFVPSWVKLFLQTSVAGAADLYCVMAATKIASQPFFGRLTNRLGPNIVSGFGMILHGLTLPLLPLSGAVWQFVLAFALLGCAMTATILPSFISLSNQVEKLQRLHGISGAAATRLYVLANALWITAFSLGAVVMPMVTGHLLDTWTYAPPLCVCP